MDYNVIIIGAVVCLVLLSLLVGSRKRNKLKLEYTKQEYLFTKNEQAFYRVLAPIAARMGYQVFAKVRLADLITPKKGSSHWQTLFNKISSKHIDFVLCDTTRYKICLAIELDDNSHHRKDRVERDKFVNEIMKISGLPLLRVWDSKDLENKLRQALKNQ